MRFGLSCAAAVKMRRPAAAGERLTRRHRSVWGRMEAQKIRIVIQILEIRRLRRLGELLSLLFLQDYF